MFKHIPGPAQLTPSTGPERVKVDSTGGIWKKYILIHDISNIHLKSSG